MTNKKRALIATHHLCSFAGSEMLTLEVSSELKKLGWIVEIAAFLKGEPMVSAFRKAGFEIVDLLQDSASINGAHFDLMWTYHLPVLYHLQLTANVTADRIVHCCLSPFEPLEGCPMPSISIDWLLANSGETKEAMQKSGYGLDRDVLIFPNAAPPSFFAFADRGQRRKNIPTKVAIVSNHLPDEIKQLVNDFKSIGIQTEIIGIEGIQRPVTPEILLDFDLVITIGKTVQYCFALKMPVYCYDRFGGPGWISSENFAEAEYHNFSGRGFGKKSSIEVRDDVVTKYGEAVVRLDFLAMQARTLFDLRENLNNLLIQPVRPRLVEISGQERLFILHGQSYYLALLKDAARAHSLQNNVLALNAYLESIRSTYWWKLSSPLRFIERYIRDRLKW